MILPRSVLRELVSFYQLPCCLVLQCFDAQVSAVSGESFSADCCYTLRVLCFDPIVNLSSPDLDKMILCVLYKYKYLLLRLLALSFALSFSLSFAWLVLPNLSSSYTFNNHRFGLLSQVSGNGWCYSCCRRSSQNGCHRESNSNLQHGGMDIIRLWSFDHYCSYIRTDQSGGIQRSSTGWLYCVDCDCECWSSAIDRIFFGLLIEIGKQLLYTTQTTLAYFAVNYGQSMANNGMTDDQRAALDPTSEEFALRYVLDLVMKKRQFTDGRT